MATTATQTSGASKAAKDDRPKRIFSVDFGKILQEKIDQNKGLIEQMSFLLEDETNNMGGKERGDYVNSNGTQVAAKTMLKKVIKDCEAAIERWKKGIFGRCSKCGKDISEPRLLVVPQANTCVNCYGRKDAP